MQTLIEEVLLKFAHMVAVLAFVGATPPTYGNAAPEQVLACGGVLKGITVVVNRDQAKCDWPFDVQEMQIRCNGISSGMGAVYFTSEKGAFGLNGKGKQTFKDPRPIWLDIDPLGMGKIDLSPWIQVGLKLC